jgi:tetratricopeptide (TPR) repeat protein
LRSNRDIAVLSADYGEEAMGDAAYASIAATIAQQGKRLVVVSGRYNLDSHDEHKEKDGPNKTKVKYVERTFTGRFAFGLSDPPKNSLHFAREVQASASEEKDENALVNVVVDAVIPDPTKAKVRGEVIDAFIYELYPHEEYYKAKFYKDSDMPELQDGIAHATIGRWDEAIDLFHKAAEKYPNHENVHKAYYNLGIAYKWNNMFAEARKNLEEAYLRKNSSEYYNELGDLARFEEEYNIRQKENAETRK